MIHEPPPFSVPSGSGIRYLDILVRNKLTGQIVGGVEAKAGTSAYTIAQQVADEWIMKNFGFPIFEYRFPFARAFFEIKW